MPVYCTPQQFYYRYDWRFVAQLVSDTGTPISDAATLATNANFLDILNQASAELDTAVRQGEKYSDAILASLYADPTWGVQIYSLVADYATGIIFARRGLDVPASLATRYKEACQRFEDLRNGVRLFNDNSHAQAGVAVVLENSCGVVTQPPVVWSNHPRFFGLPWL